MTDAFTFGFPLDDFQLDALRALDEGRSVVVCAPTGSGKTVVAEHAIHLALARGQRLFYTTPLKALSNQKFRDFSRRYGPEQVGLLTGDVSIRGGAPVVIMTTEVFRNMLFGVGRNGGRPPTASRPPHPRWPPSDLADAPGNDLAALRFVVLDECHYINDAGRGTVWEESILGSPPSVQLVALSATIANPEQLAGWIREVHGPTDLILSDERPVPLEHHYYSTGQLSPLSPTADRRPPTADDSSLIAHHSSLITGPAPSAWHQPLLRGPAGREVRSWETAVDPDEVVTALAEREMLPAIYFVFSRQGCEAALLRCAPLELLSAVERQRARERIKAFLEEGEERFGASGSERQRLGPCPGTSLRLHPHLRYLARGLAVHHAGLLPAWKRVVEELFQAGLVRVVFATETLAAGINMPARTTVISSLHKPASGRGPRAATRRPLTASEFLQMSGRAGRRGMDRLGHVVVVGDPHVPRAEAVRLASAPPDPLFSRFAPGYSLVVHLLQHCTLEEIRDLLQRSFGEYLARGRRGEGAKERGNEEGYWRRFLGLKSVLDEYGYVSENRLNALAMLVGSIRATNELLVAEVVRHEKDAAITPAEFAGALVALVTEPKTSPPPSRSRALAPSPPRSLPSPRARALLTEIDRAAGALRVAQQRHRVDVPVSVAHGAVAWTEAWASGASWESVLAVADADEGDVVYTLRSLIDLLRQVAAAPGVPERTRGLAREAVRAIDRDPVDAVI